MALQHDEGNAMHEAGLMFGGGATGEILAYGGEGAKPEPAKPKPAEKPKEAPKPAPKS